MIPSSADPSQLPTALRSLIEAELNPGEKITWVGVPIPGRLAMRALPIVWFGIPWTAFALYWMARAYGFMIPDFHGGSGNFPLFGIPFVLMGFWMLSSPYRGWRAARKTVYALTTERAIIIQGGSSKVVQSFRPDRLADLRRTQQDDGSGGLIFERRVTPDGSGDHRSADHGFLAVADVQAVERRVRHLVEASTRRET
jgi:hypothetical protein